jgi:hypothetical protein
MFFTFQVSWIQIHGRDGQLTRRQITPLLLEALHVVVQQAVMQVHLANIYPMEPTVGQTLIFIGLSHGILLYVDGNCSAYRKHVINNRQCEGTTVTLARHLPACCHNNFARSPCPGMVSKTCQPISCELCIRARHRNRIFLRKC